MKTYSDKLKDPRWQRKRLEVMQRDNFKCSQCKNGDITLNVHHWQYSKEPWDAKNEDLTTVCHLCHKEIEHCKALTKELLRQFDFRELLSNIERLLLKNKELKVIAFEDCVTVVIEEMKLYSVDEVLSEKGYRYLENGETYEIGDEFWNDGWEVLTYVCEDNIVGMSPDTRYRRRIDETKLSRMINEMKIRRRADELSDFDRLIESAPDNY
jgi:hypothetical protein